jgi:hypothetical protein
MKQPTTLILYAILPREINLEFWLLTPLLFASGDLLGRRRKRLPWPA